MKKRFLSCLLILCMVFSLLPVSALATTDVEVTLGRKSLGQIERTLEMNTGISGYKDTTQQLAPESVTLPVGQQGSFQRLPTTIINNVQYSPKSYGVIRGRCVDVSDPEVVGNFQYSLEYYTGTNYPCLQFNYTAKQAGTATITLEFFYNFGFNPIEAPDIGNTWWRQTKTINVTVTDSATEPEKPEKPTVSDIKRFHNKVNTTSSSEGAVYMWCADSLYDHGAWFSYLTDVEGGYSLGEVVANTESNAASYPWVCPMTVYGDKYLAAYNSAPGFTRHWLEDGEPVSQTVNWYYSAGDGMWKYKSKAAPIYFDITHDNPYPTPTTTDFANQAILVKCDTDDNHNAQLLYSDGTYTISWAGDDRCTLTFDVDSYVAAYGQTHEGHTAVEGQTVTKGFSYSNGKWRADDTSGPEIHVVCESTQPERPTEFGKEQLAGMQVNVQCKTVTGHAKSYYFGELAGCYSTSAVMEDSEGGYHVTVTLDRSSVVEKFNADEAAGGKTHDDTEPDASTSWTWTWDANDKVWRITAPITGAWATISVECEPEPTIIHYVLVQDFNYKGTGSTTWTQTASTAKDSYTFNVLTGRDGDPKRENYKFLGWADESTATTAQYQAGNPIVLTRENPTKTIYAVWTPCDHSYEWVDNGDGTHSKECTECGHKKDEKENHADGNNDGTCDKCGAVMQNPPTDVPELPGENEKIAGSFYFTCESSVSHYLKNSYEVALQTRNGYTILNRDQGAQKDENGYYFDLQVNATPYLSEYDTVSGKADHTICEGEMNPFTIRFHYVEKVWVQDSKPTVKVECNGTQPETPPTKPELLDGGVTFKCVADVGHPELVIGLMSYTLWTEENTDGVYAISDVQSDGNGGWYVIATVYLQNCVDKLNENASTGTGSPWTGTTHVLCDKNRQTLTIRFNYDSTVAGVEVGKWKQEGDQPVVDVTCATKIFTFFRATKGNTNDMLTPSEIGAERLNDLGLTSKNDWFTYGTLFTTETLPAADQKAKYKADDEVAQKIIAAMVGRDENTFKRDNSTIGFTKDSNIIWPDTSDYPVKIERASTHYVDDDYDVDGYAYHLDGKLPFYTVSYDANGGTGDVPATSYYLEGETYTVDTTAPTRDGYKFLGWATTVDAETPDVGATFNMPGNNVTLHAVWQEKTFFVGYWLKDENGEWQRVHSENVPYTEATTHTLWMPTIPDGYAFDGWYQDDKDVGKEGRPKFTTMTQAKKWEFYADFTAIEYEIHYEYRDKDIAEKKLYPDNKTTYTVKDTVTLKDITAKGEHGKKFAQWRWDTNGDGVADTALTEIPAGTTGNLTIYAYWNYPVNYTVFDKNGDKIDSLSETEYVLEDVLSKDGYKLTALTKDGYTFDGWYQDDDDLGKTEKLIEDQTLKTAKKWELYGKLTPKEYTVTFNPNAEGASVIPTSKLVTFGKTYGEPEGELPTPTREGYTFEGWYLSKTEFTPANKVEATTIVKATADHTLYANWTANTYTVTFNPKGGEVNPREKNVTFDAAYGELPTPTRTGYTFNGWYLGDKEITKDSTVETAEDHTLTASWSINSHWLTIKYLNKSNGKELAPEYSQKHDYDTTVKVKSPSIPGYKFYDRDDETVVVTMPDEDVTRIVYYVRKTGNGGGTYDSPNKTKKTSPALTLNTADHFAFINGYPDGSVQPEGNVTRAETAAILYRIMGDDCQSYYKTTSCSYSDVARGDWFNTYVATLENAGVIVDTRTNGKFRPNDAITRAELASMIAQFAGLDSASAANFNDVGTIYWAAKEIAIAAKMGWINGYPDGSFRPNQNVTRAELMAMVNRALGRTPKSEDDLLSGMKTWSDNANTGAWYYLDVQEATNSHTYTKSGTHETWKKLR